MESALKVTDSDFTVYLHPSKSNKVGEAILRELSSLLFTFNETFEGVVLAYDVNTVDNCAKILPGVNPYFGIRLKAKLLLFCPKPDMLLEGKVVKLTQESIHVIVLGFASAVITDKEIRDEFVYKIKRGEEVYVSRLQKRHAIKVGTVIRFLVKSFDEEILHCLGSLIPALTGSIHWLDRNSDNVAIEGRSDKKRNRESEKESLEQEHNSVGDETYMTNDHKGNLLKKEKK